MQTIADLRAACAALPGSLETFPFGPATLVFKVGAIPALPDEGASALAARAAAQRAAAWKMYALAGLDGDPVSLSLKCDPARAEELRALHAGITPGYHLDKRHWITLRLDDALPEGLALALLRHSHALVLRGLPRAVRELIGATPA